MFASGKLVCTGAKTEREVYEAVYKLKNILEENKLITYTAAKQLQTFNKLTIGELSTTQAKVAVEYVMEELRFDHLMRWV